MGQAARIMRAWQKGWWPIMPDTTSASPSKRSRLKTDPFTDLDMMVAQAAARHAGEVKAPAPTPAPPAAEPAAETQPPQSAQPAARLRSGSSVVFCPFVGIAEDPATRFLEADPNHRCFAMARPAPILDQHQRTYCLSSRYTKCETFLLARQAMASAQKGDKVQRGLLARLLGRK